MLYHRVFYYFLTAFFFAQLSWAEDIRDVKPPVDFPPNYLLLWIILGLIVVAVVFLLTRFLITKSRGKKISVASPKLPHEIAFERLAELQKRNLPAVGQMKEFYSVLSDIIRHYIEERFSIKAPEMTTQEFLWFLNSSSRLLENHKIFLKDFLISCDMVKFAKHAPELNEIDSSFQLAKKFVEETKETPTLLQEKNK